MMIKNSLIKYSSQDTYSQQLSDFLWEEKPFSGEGKCTFHDGAGYDGLLKASSFNGKGIFTWPDGSRYEGQWRNDLPHGVGTILLADGYRYEGDWKNGVAEGRGTETLPDGGRYKGQWKNGLKHGRGEIIYANGKKYRGEWKDGIHNGRGILFFSDGPATRENGRITPSSERDCSYLPTAKSTEGHGKEPNLTLLNRCKSLPHSLAASRTAYKPPLAVASPRPAEPPRERGLPVMTPN